MSKPDTPAVVPKAVTLAAGDEVWWCSCGKSKDQPFCDGSHRVTEFEPLQYKVTKSGTFAFCQCKLTKTPPFCDGSHKELAD
jgi:CDGSH-type Zn-finger protein